MRKQHEQMIKAIEIKAKENVDGKESAQKIANDLRE